jgi:hypothetical protein
MAMMSPSQVVADLRLRLVHVAADPAEQISYLQSIGPISVDELALELGEALDLAWIPREAGVVTGDQLGPALGVRDMLRELSSQHPELWTQEGLASAEWDRVRKAARDALQAL